jgi:queuosine precursor transporter
MKILLYIASIIIANVVTAAFMPLTLGVFIIPCGTLFIGLTFIFRDLVQQQVGKAKTYMVIVTALILSALSSYLLGDTLWIVFASALSFLVSETSDTEIFSRLKTTFAKRVLFSGLVGGLLDSTIFVIVGLSPIGAGFFGWELVIYAILGQVIVKSIMQFLGYLVFAKIVKLSESY